MENYVDPSKAKDMMVVDCHTSMSQQKQYFDKMEDKLAHEHSKLVARALKEKEQISKIVAPPQNPEKDFLISRSLFLKK